MSALYLAYGLIVSSTLIPISVSILIEEANLNILDRSKTYSEAGEYWSFLEYIAEEFGLYQDDMKLHEWAIAVLKEYIDTLGLSPMTSTLGVYYQSFLEWLLTAIDIKYTLRDFIFDILKILYSWFFGTVSGTSLSSKHI